MLTPSESSPPRSSLERGPSDDPVRRWSRGRRPRDVVRRSRAADRAYAVAGIRAPRRRDVRQALVSEFVINSFPNEPGRVMLPERCERAPSKLISVRPCPANVANEPRAAVTGSHKTVGRVGSICMLAGLSNEPVPDHTLARAYATTRTIQEAARPPADAERSQSKHPPSQGSRDAASAMVRRAEASRRGSPIGTARRRSSVPG